MNNADKNNKDFYNSYLRKSLQKDTTPRSIGNLVRNQAYIAKDNGKKHILCSLVYDNSQQSKEDPIDYTTDREI